MLTDIQSLSQQKRQIDISALQDYKIDTKDDWADWSLKNDQYSHIPLGFSNRLTYLKNLRYCDLSLIQNTQQDTGFVVVEDNVKRKNKDFISKYEKMSEYIQSTNTRRTYYKKSTKFTRGYTNQQKTNFKKITVKNDWQQIHTIKKNNLQQAPQIQNPKVQSIKTIGTLYQINPEIDRVNWQEVKFRQNKAYTVDPIKTANDPQLIKITQKLMEEQNKNKVSIICHPTFLLSLLTVRASVYPWNIQIQKIGNLIVLQSFKNSEDQSQKLTYLDLFTTNQNTSNNMPNQEAKVKQICITATKMTKIFKDLLVSGDQIDKEDIQDLFSGDIGGQQQKEQEQVQQQQEQQEQEQEKEKEELDRIRKYIKISFDKIDIYTFVEIDGAKRNSTTGALQYYLIRTFMESQSQGKWIKDMKTPGSLITKEYQSNTCNIEKWICEAKLAGVQEIKTGYIGMTSNKNPVLLNVQGASVKSLQNTLSFRYQNCWTAARYILNLLVKLEDGNYVLSKAPYTPLSIKLYKTSSGEDQFNNIEQQQQQQEEDDSQKKQTKKQQMAEQSK